jgi:hypothetical protein
MLMPIDIFVEITMSGKQAAETSVTKRIINA